MAKSNTERCRERRERLRQDPARYEREKRLDTERRKFNYHKQRTPEEIDYIKRLNREAQRRYQAKKKLEAEAKVVQGLPAPMTARLDAEKIKQKREANRRYVQKHRAQQSAQKRQRVQEKNLQYYHRKKAERQAVEAGPVSSPKSSRRPFGTQSAAQRAVQRIKQRLRASGAKLPFLLKGTKRKHVETIPSPLKKLKEHILGLQHKRDKESLVYKRRLAEALGDSAVRVGVSPKCMTPAPQLYKRTAANMNSGDIATFYEAQSFENPCQRGPKRQLLKPVAELHKDFSKLRPGVSLRTFHHYRPKNVASVKSLKFRQCKCDVRENPNLKLKRLNKILMEKCESVRVLLEESVCDVEVHEMPKYECVKDVEWSM